MFINLPTNSELPNEVTFFTAEENLIMILVGIKAVNTMKENYVSQEYEGIVKEYECRLERKNNENTALKQVYDEIITLDRVRQENRIKEEIKIENERISMGYKDLVEKYGKDAIEYQEKIEKLNLVVQNSKSEIVDME